MLRSGMSWTAIQEAACRSRATIAKVSKQRRSGAAKAAEAIADAMGKGHRISQEGVEGALTVSQAT